jgi:hypothetical protein
LSKENTFITTSEGPTDVMRCHRSWENALAL